MNKKPGSLPVEEKDITIQKSNRVIRELVLYELCKAMPKNGPAITTVRAFGIIWLHFTDWFGRFNLPLLVEHGILRERNDLVFDKRVSWKNDFSPTAYQLTVKGRGILDNQKLWVENGEWIR